MRRNSNNSTATPITATSSAAARIEDQNPNTEPPKRATTEYAT